MNALKANGDDIRSCRDAKASISSLIGTLRRAIEHASTVERGKRNRREWTQRSKSASVVVTCMEAANETEQVGMRFRHHRRGSSSASSHSSFGN